MREESKKNVDSFSFPRVCLSLHDQSKVHRYNDRLIYLKTRVTTTQKHTIDSQNQTERYSSIIEKKNQTRKGKTRK